MQMSAFGTAMQMVFREKIEETPQPHTHTRTEKKNPSKKSSPPRELDGFCECISPGMGLKFQ
jgi:hypothetical protein